MQMKIQCGEFAPSRKAKEVAVFHILQVTEIYYYAANILNVTSRYPKKNLNYNIEQPFQLNIIIYLNLHCKSKIVVECTGHNYISFRSASETF